jgi:two-component system heavy metal sensor histidine kinase CusS
MLWKKSNKPALDRTKSGRPRRLSITARLTLLFTVAGIGVLILTSSFLYWILINRMEAEDNLYLVEGASHIQEALNEGGVEFFQNKLRDAERFHSLVVNFRILDEKSLILFQTPGMSAAVSPKAFPVAHKVITKSTKGVAWRSGTGKSYLLLAAECRISAPSPEKTVIQIAFDITDDYNLIAEYAKKLGVAVIMGTLIFAIAGFFIAGRGLRPLREISDKVQKVTSTHLDERMTEKRWPKELAGLAGAFDIMLARLEGSFTGLSEFSANIAHELRNPINNLMGEAEVSISQNRTADEYRRVLESNLEELAKLSRLIDNLLFLARAENPATHIECSRFDAFGEIKKICDFFEALAEGKGVELICSGTGFLIADPGLFNRAVSNLLENSLHFNPPGGKIEISVIQPNEKSLEITVRDNGPGIKTEDLPHLFDRFFRGNSARSDHPEGTGLGLAIVKSIMALHGGSVTIQNRAGGGTEARLLFVCSSLNSEKCMQEKNSRS